MHDRNAKMAKRPQPRLIHHWCRPRTIRIGAMKHKRRIPQPDDPIIPCATLHGMWMTLAGIEVGMDLFLEVGPGWVTMRTPGTPRLVPAAAEPGVGKNIGRR